MYRKPQGDWGFRHGWVSGHHPASRPLAVLPGRGRLAALPSLLPAARPANHSSKSPQWKPLSCLCFPGPPAAGTARSEWLSSVTGHLDRMQSRSRRRVEKNKRQSNCPGQDGEGAGRRLRYRPGRWQVTTPGRGERVSSTSPREPATDCEALGAAVGEPGSPA